MFSWLIQQTFLFGAVLVAAYFIWRFSPRFAARVILHSWRVEKKFMNEALLAPIRRNLQETARRSRMPEPELWILSSFAVNIAALPISGRKGAIVITHGAIHQLSGEELSVSFQMCMENFKSRDLRIVMRLTALFWPFYLVAQILPRFFTILLEPILALGLRLALRPKRSFILDRRVLQNKNRVEAEVNALRKAGVEAELRRLPEQNVLTMPYWLFQNRTSAKELWRFFLQPPAVEERIQRLLSVRMPS